MRLRFCRRIAEAPWLCSGRFLPPRWHASSLMLTRRRQQKWVTHRKQKAPEGWHEKQQRRAALHVSNDRRWNLRLRVAASVQFLWTLIPAECGRHGSFDSLTLRQSDVILKGKVGKMKTERETWCRLYKFHVCVCSGVRWMIWTTRRAMKETTSLMLWWKKL